MAMAHQLPVAGVVEAVIAGIARGLQDLGVEARFNWHYEAKILAKPPVCRNWMRC